MEGNLYVSKASDGHVSLSRPVGLSARGKRRRGPRGKEGEGKGRTRGVLSASEIASREPIGSRGSGSIDHANGIPSILRRHILRIGGTRLDHYRWMISEYRNVRRIRRAFRATPLSRVINPWV